VLPVWTLLQPRDYINSHELFLALGLLVVGLFVAGAGGQADLTGSAPALARDVPADAPPIWPFLFIVVACGAVSGFHSLVSSGTSSKQVALEPHAQLVGYGSMLLEGALAVVVILTCCAGLGMGLFKRVSEKGTAAYSYVAVKGADGQPLLGREAWRVKYQPRPTKDPATGKMVGGWANHKLPQKVGAFIEGGANFLARLGIPLKLGVGILAVLVASFAATTLDTATRLQRYVIQELAATVKVRPLTNRYAATAVALILAGYVAIFTGRQPGGGGMILWPMFGALNQLLAGLVFIVIVFYLIWRQRPFWMTIPATAVMLVMPAWAMLHQMFSAGGWLFGEKPNYLLFGFGLATQLLLVWLIVEAAISLRAWLKCRQGPETATPAG
jgi:carbon starvation protein